MKIAGYLQTSLLEWPGKISAVVFLPGCDFRCPFCHNKDLVLSPQKLPAIPEEEVLTDLEKRKKWIDGVVFTGGEPTLTADLVDFLEKVKGLGFLTMMETNGTKPEVLKRLFKKKLLDRLSLDVKTELESEAYTQAAGAEVDLEAIKKSIKMVANSGLEFEFRTTVVSTIHTQESLVRLAKQLKEIGDQASESAGLPWWFLQQFRSQDCLDPRFEKIKPYDLEFLEKVLAAAKRHFPQTKLRGV